MENLDIPPLYRHDDDSDEEAPGDVSDMSWLEYDGRGGFTIRDDDYVRSHNFGHVTQCLSLYSQTFIYCRITNFYDVL